MILIYHRNTEWVIDSIPICTTANQSKYFQIDHVHVCVLYNVHQTDIV
jgi:hypothetical protein